MFKKNSETGFKIIAHVMTIIFLTVIIIPLAYIVSLSLQDENAIYTYPPKFLPKAGTSISIVIDYSQYKDINQDELKDMVLKDSTLAMYSTIYEFNMDSVSEVKVYGTVNGKTVFYSRAHGLMLKLQLQYGVYSMAQVSSKVLLLEGRYKKSAEEIGYQYNVSGINKNYDTTRLGSDDFNSKVGEFLKSSYKTSGEYRGTVVNKSYLQLLENYKYYFKMPQLLYKNYSNIKNYSFFAFMFNTILTFIWAMLCQIILCALTAYPLSKLLNKRASDIILLFFLATMMIPFVTIMIPQLQLMMKWGMYNNYTGMLFPWLLPSPFFILLYKGFFDRIPSSFFEAARIDGSTELNTFLRICIPMSKPIIALIALQSFIVGWTDFFWYFLVANKPNLWTLNVAVYIISQLQQVRQNFLMGLSVVTITPVLIVTAVFSKQIKASIMSSGIKG